MKTENGSVLLQRDDINASYQSTEIEFRCALTGWMPGPGPKLAAAPRPVRAAKHFATLVLISGFSPNPERTLATIECLDDPALRPVFDLLCQSVKRHYPEAAEPSDLALPETLTGDGRNMVTFWRQGLSNREIGEQLNMTKDTIRTRLAELRRVYGQDVVPLDRDRRRLLRNR